MLTLVVVVDEKDSEWEGTGRSGEIKIFKSLVVSVEGAMEEEVTQVAWGKLWKEMIF